MIVIQDILISEDLLTEKFVCNLSKCKGACCWEGDYGAPVGNEEIETINKLLPAILPQLPPHSQELIAAEGGFEFFDDPDLYGTRCHSDGACVFLTFDELGIAKCGIEKTFEMGLIDYRKPISCHLYPLRVNRNETLDYEVWNYETWDICSAACTLGSDLKVPVYAFLKDAIIRYKGEEFYEELQQAGTHFQSK